MVEHWYGWQILIVDASWIVLGVATAGIDSQSAIHALPVLTYALGPPIVHWAHGRVGIGFADLGIRVVGPFAVGLLGAVVGAAAGANSTNQSDDAAAGFVVGALVGFLSALIVDPAVLAYEKVPAEPAAAKANDKSWFTLAPVAKIGGRDPNHPSTFGLGGVF